MVNPGFAFFLTSLSTALWKRMLAPKWKWLLVKSSIPVYLLYYKIIVEIGQKTLLSVLVHCSLAVER